MPSNKTESPGFRFASQNKVVHAFAAVAGMGLAWLPCWLVAHYLQRGELEMVFNSTQVAPTDVYVVRPKTKYLTAKNAFGY